VTLPIHLQSRVSRCIPRGPLFSSLIIPPVPVPTSTSTPSWPGYLISHRGHRQLPGTPSEVLTIYLTIVYYGTNGLGVSNTSPAQLLCVTQLTRHQPQTPAALLPATSWPKDIHYCIIIMIQDPSSPFEPFGLTHLPVRWVGLALQQRWKNGLDPDIFFFLFLSLFVLPCLIGDLPRFEEPVTLQPDLI
jgi:hypothetical protein